MKFVINIARGVTHCDRCPFVYYGENGILKCGGVAMQDMLGIDCTKYDLSTMYTSE